MSRNFWHPIQSSGISSFNKLNPNYLVHKKKSNWVSLVFFTTPPPPTPSPPTPLNYLVCQLGMNEWMNEWMA
jgi:hypothetical protein